MSEIIIPVSSTSLQQKIYAIKDGNLVEQKEVHLTDDDLTSAIAYLANKYNIANVNFTGNKEFTCYFVEQVKEKFTNKYTVNLNINYVN